MTQPTSAASRAANATQAHLSQFSDNDMAYHESGHAVIHHLNGGTIQRLSIDRADPRRGTQPSSPRGAEKKPGLGHVIAVLVAGDVAGQEHGTAENLTTAGSRVDYDQAFRAAAEAGFDRDEARAMIDSKWERVRTQLREPASWRLVEALAQALLKQRTLDAEQVKAILAR